MSDLPVAIGATLLALLGLVLAAGAEDHGIFTFGMGLVVFGALFDFFLLKRHFDEAESPSAKSRIS
jgi:hypothetical protein